MNNKWVMKMEDSDTENDTNIDINQMLCKLFSKFIRLRSVDKYRQSMRSNDCASLSCKQNTKLRSCKDANNNNEMNTSDSEMENDERYCDDLMRVDEIEGSGDEIDMRIQHENGIPFEWQKVWRELNASLDSIKFNNENHKCLENYTLLLKLHVNHRLILDMSCYRCLLHCIRPELIEKLFDLNLIDKEDAFHVGCLIESDDLFTGIDVLADSIEGINKYSPKVLYSLSVLIYKDKECLNHANKIVNSMNSELAVFINREERDERRIRSPIYVCLKQAVKQFLIACALNGVFVDQKKLESFLTNRDIESANDSLSESSLSDLISDSDDDSSGSSHGYQEMHRLHQAENNQQLRVNLPYNPRSPPPPPPPNNANNNNNLPKSVADRMGISMNEFKKLLYPMSLKNLCRIQIKTYLDPYDLNSVNKLTILPNMLKRFVMFQDEIDEIKKLAQN